MTTFYDVLGVHREADARAIKAAFRRLAKSFHPDLNAGDDRATLQFQQVLAAYQVLGNPPRRSAYDCWLEITSTRALQRRSRTALRWGAIVAAGAGFSVAVTMFVSLWPSGDGSVASLPPHTAVLSADRDAPLRDGLALPERDVAAVSIAAGRWRDAGQRSAASHQRAAPRSSETIGARIGSRRRDVAALASAVAAPAVDRAAALAGSDVLAFAADGQPQAFRRAAAPSVAPPVRNAVDRPLATVGEASAADPPVFAAQAAAWPPRGWTTYRDDRFAFSLSYPSGFTARPAEPDDLRRVFLSGDGRARLVVIARPRSEESLSSLRHSMINSQYAAASFDYAPVRGNWFVLSGTMGPEMFYERVSLACAGRVVVAWKLTYPVAHREAYDRIVEGIHRRFRYRAGSTLCG